MKFHRHQTGLSSPYTSCCTFFLLSILVLAATSEQVWANPDVYAFLPDDTRVIQYDTGDLDGDLREELAVLFTSRDKVRLALFSAPSGYWSPWWENTDLIDRERGTTAHSVELADTNGDGRDEILIYYLTLDNKAMVARILAMETGEPDHPSARILLEEMTSPPGYPLLGTENGSPSVTFLNMPLQKGDTGYRRVYCWDGDRFEQCVEVPWQKP